MVPCLDAARSSPQLPTNMRQLPLAKHVHLEIHVVTNSAFADELRDVSVLLLHDDALHEHVFELFVLASSLGLELDGRCVISAKRAPCTVLRGHFHRFARHLLEK